MWSIVVLSVMLSLTALYASIDKEGMAAAEQAKAESLADSMAIYREAVTLHFTRNPGSFQSVAIGTLISTNALPNWSTLYQQPATSIWANYRDSGNGMIYIYAASPPPVNIVSDVVKLSQNSVLAGMYRTGDTTLYSPVVGDTGISLPPQANAQIPNRSPVWVAMRK
jgi:hypothetical protein